MGDGRDEKVGRAGLKVAQDNKIAEGRLEIAMDDQSRRYYKEWIQKQKVN